MAVTHSIGVAWAGNGGAANIPQKNVLVSGTGEVNVDGFFLSGVTFQAFALSSGQAQSFFITSDAPIQFQLNQSGGSTVSGGYTFTVPAGGVTVFASGLIGSQPFSGAILQSYVFCSGSALVSGANVSVRTNLI